MGKSIDDFSPGPSLIKGEHAQQLVDAIRELDRRDGYNTSRPEEFILVEMWPGKVLGPHVKPRTSLSDPEVIAPAMYDVQRCYIYTDNTDVFPNLQPDWEKVPDIDPATGVVDGTTSTRDEYHIYPVTNVLEMGAGGTGTNNLVQRQEVIVKVFFDRGNPSRKRYLMEVATTIASGQYQYQSFQMVSQNQSGWDFVRAHPLI